jgi:hypothetical protein
MEIFQMRIFVHYLLLTFIMLPFSYHTKWDRSIISLHVYFFTATFHSFNILKLSCCILSSEPFTYSLWFSMMSDISLMLVVSMCSWFLVGSVSHNWHMPTEVFSKAAVSGLAAGTESASVWCKIVLKKKRQSQSICLVHLKNSIRSCVRLYDFMVVR